MSQHLPDHFDPWRFADLAKRIDGSYRLQDLPRLVDCLADTQGDVRFELKFSRDGQARSCLHGTVDSELHLECQRCLGEMSFVVRSKLALAFVEGLEEAERLPDYLEPQLVENGRVQLKDLIEDELLLALPQVPMHPEDECASGLNIETDEKVSADASVSPFAILAELRRRNN